MKHLLYTAWILFAARAEAGCDSTQYLSDINFGTQKIWVEAVHPLEEKAVSDIATQYLSDNLFIDRTMAALNSESELKRIMRSDFRTYPAGTRFRLEQYVRSLDQSFWGFKLQASERESLGFNWEYAAFRLGENETGFSMLYVDRLSTKTDSKPVPAAENFYRFKIKDLQSFLANHFMLICE